MAGRKGMRKHRPLAPDQARQRMWKAMRGLRTFTCADIEAAAETTYTHTRRYVRDLGRWEYLAQVSPRASGVTGGHAIWRLVKNTGPVAPRLSSDGLYDANVAEPLERPDDKPLNRHASAVLQMLRLVIDRVRQSPPGGKLTSEMHALLAQADELVLKAEGHA